MALKLTPLCFSRLATNMAEQSQSSSLKPCNVEKFLTAIRLRRDLEDRIVYRLNDAVRTNSMRSKSFKTETGDNCLGLKNELQAGRTYRSQAINECLASHEIAIDSYKEKLANEEAGFKKSVLKRMVNDRYALISDQETEFTTRSRVDKLFDQKCDGV